MALSYFVLENLVRNGYHPLNPQRMRTESD